MVQAELVQGGGEMGRGEAAEVAPTHLTPLVHWESAVRRGHGSEKTNGIQLASHDMSLLLQYVLVVCAANLSGCVTCCVFVSKLSSSSTTPR